MKNKSLWVDAFFGLLLSAFVVASYLTLPLPGADLLMRLELQSYDLRAQLRGNIDPSAEIVIVEIGEDSLDRHGRWPFSRAKIARLVDVLERAKPRVIGLNILYSEPADNAAFAELEGLKTRYQDLLQRRRIVARGVRFDEEFDAAKRRLDTDSALLASLTTAQAVIVLPVGLTGSVVAGGKVPDVPPALKTSGVRLRAAAPSPDRPTPALLPAARKIIHPLPALLRAVDAVGHVRIVEDIDGVVRSDLPVMQYGEDYLPSFPLQIAAAYLGVKPKDIQVAPGEAVTLGSYEVPIDAASSMLVTYNGGARTFRYYPFHEVLEGKVSLDVFKDKIVLVGVTAPGASDLHVTPLSNTLPGVEVVANVVENLLNKRFISRPPWAAHAELGAIALMALFIMFVLPNLRALSGITLTVLLVGGLLGAGAYLFKERAQWLRVSYPAFLLGVGYLVIVSRRFLFSERRSELVEASAAETHKMLGLSFQGQGQLDAAFEKFRACPLDAAMMETIYHLGLDFERKRQYAKAVSCYQHIAAADAGFKDIAQKIDKLGRAADGAVFGGPKAGSEATGTVLTPEGAEKATLGRYEIEKELGRGAMGIVYLGRDPKINRRVAIKTLLLEDGASAAEVKDVKERFFREAESAGTLNHPGIVRIFDAGEDKDVCYIAMELLDGTDLTAHTKKDKRLPLKTALEYIATVADALEYAHAQGIVHRDIKPANIMRLADGAVRVTDFGIARITASSKTATGTVMGTPSYMSPEQIAGKKVDGRSDLFSLGVVLYEFVCGEKPFKGGEGIGTLLFQIANDPAPDPAQVEPATPPEVARIILKALEKSPERRYQTGGELAADLRAAAAAPMADESNATPDEVVADLRMENTSPDLRAEAAAAAETSQPIEAAPEEEPAPGPLPAAPEDFSPVDPASEAAPAEQASAAAQDPAGIPGEESTQTLAADPPAAPELVAGASVELPETEPQDPGGMPIASPSADAPAEDATQALAEEPSAAESAPEIDLGPRAFGGGEAPVAPAAGVDLGTPSPLGGDESIALSPELEERPDLGAGGIRLAAGIEPTQAGLAEPAAAPEATEPLPAEEAAQPPAETPAQSPGGGLELPPEEFLPKNDALVFGGDTASFTPGDVADSLPTPEDAPGAEPESETPAVKLEWPGDPEKPA